MRYVIQYSGEDIFKDYVSYLQLTKNGYFSFKELQTDRKIIN
jgi:hypothetical protein